MAFRMVSAALLENFLQTNENNFDDILAHIEDGRKHPPGRHWVNNLRMPTLLAGSSVSSVSTGHCQGRPHCRSTCLPP